MRGIGSWVVAGLLLTACGDDGENGRDGGENGRDGGENERDDLEDAGLDAEELRQMAVQKCDDLVEKFCTRVSSCAEAEDLLDESYPAAELNMDCRAAIGEALPCETSVAPG